ncbi:LON peptidase substrate-binding domain-containing protein [Dokdonella koreensis]|nr:LON peptidase substrate-binding domain-containing protein [Dokdonella koreensis]
MAAADCTDLPLFPLSNVLFPGGTLRLRIFEPRYLDLVRECSREGRGFGVCLIIEGAEVGEPATPAAIGTIAHITDFYTLDQGLLGITAEGRNRFHVERTRVRDNGLVRGDIRAWDEERTIAVPAEFGLLPTILDRLLGQMNLPARHADRSCFDDASWVGFRMAELLPLAAGERQHLLEIVDPLQRLALLRDALPRFQRE